MNMESYSFFHFTIRTPVSPLSSLFFLQNIIFFLEIQSIWNNWINYGNNFFFLAGWFAVCSNLQEKILFFSLPQKKCYKKFDFEKKEKAS